MKRPATGGGPYSGWKVIWEGPEPMATSAEEMLVGNGLEVKKVTAGEAHIYVPEADAATAKMLLRDWGM